MRGRLPQLRLGLIVCLFAFVLGARWAVVERYGTDLPFWDQWDAEGLDVLAPWHQGQLTLAKLFQHHNEHRVVLTKLVNFGLTIANGQWDQRLETAVNAAIAALIAVAFFAWGTAFLRSRWHAPLFFLLAALYGMPFASENVINGFHSQQLFLVGLSFGAIVGATAPGDRLGYRWIGIACMALALLSMASGFFAAAIVLGALLLLGIRRERTWRTILPIIVISMFLVAAACLTRVSVPGHEVIKAHSLAEFTSAFFQCSEWPVGGENNAWLSILLWLPWCWLVWCVLRGAGETARGPGIAIACLGAWVILQILATAYARGAGGPPPAYRYVDNLIVGTIANALALGWLFERGGLDRGRKRACMAIAVLWLATFAAGCAFQLWTVFRYQLPEGKAYRDQCVENVRGYLATGDESYLRHPEIPYPSPDNFLVRIKTPPLRELLPASVRDPLPLADSRNGGFIRIDSRRREEARSPAPGIGSPTELPPECPPLSNAVFWSSFRSGKKAGGGEWESVALVAPQSGWLRFEVAGRPAEMGSELEIRDAATGRILASLRPGNKPGDSWRSAYVRAPAQPFVVVAHDTNPESWIAFSQPVEMGTLSYFAWRCVKNGLLLAELSAAAAFALILYHQLRS